MGTNRKSGNLDQIAEAILYCEAGETLELVDQGGCG